MRARGRYSKSTSLLWDQFLPRSRAMGLGGQPLLLVGIDDPSITDPELCRMDACVEIPADWSFDDTCYPRHEMPARWVASLDYEGPSEDIGLAWNKLLTEWLPQAPFGMADGHFYQWHEPDDGPPDSRWVQCKLCMPVKPRNS